MNIKIKYHLMPWEIDFALLSFEKLKKSSYYLSTDDTIYIDTVLNLSSYIIDWNKSKLPKEYFIEKYKTLSKLLEWSEHTQVVYDDNNLYGHLDYEKEWVDPKIDYYIGMCPDMWFHEHLLFYLIEAAKQVKDDHFIITPEIYKMWDGTWDILTNKNYLDIPYTDWDKGDVFDLSHFMSTNEEVASLKPSPAYKWAGWFDLYSKKFIEELVPVPNHWKGYGPWDFYSMICSSIANKNGVPVKQYVLENQVIFEHTTGTFKENNLTSYYKNNLHLNDIPNQRKEIEKTFNQDIRNWENKFLTNL
jgi:hypothetical protein